MNLCRKKHIHVEICTSAIYEILMKSSNIPCVIIRNICTFSNDSEIRNFARRNLDIPKDTHYLNMIYSTMIAVRYMHFSSKKEHKILQILISNTHFRKKLAVMHLCLSMSILDIV